VAQTFVEDKSDYFQIDSPEVRNKNPSFVEDTVETT
jgi:hypothetical protein